MKTSKSENKNTSFLYSLNWKGRLFIAFLALTFVFFLVLAVACNLDNTNTTEETTDYITEDSTPADLQTLIASCVAEAGVEKRYNLTEAERWEIASVITAEAVGEPYAGKVAVAQCILQACEDDGIRPAEVLSKSGYSTARPEPCKEALEAVQAVFDFGQVATAEPIKYFYAPGLTQSEWHESQGYVMTINGHKFFKEVTSK